jgi:hypothetical protein
MTMSRLLIPTIGLLHLALAEPASAQQAISPTQARQAAESIPDASNKALEPRGPAGSAARSAEGYVPAPSHIVVPIEPDLTAIILVCSAALARPDCTVATATDMLAGLDANTPIECLMNGEALIAQSGLASQLEKGHYLKVVCVPKETVADAVQRLDGDPPPFVHTHYVLRPPVTPSP